MRLIVELVIDTGQRYLAELGPHGGNVAYARLELLEHARLLRCHHAACIDADTGEVLLWRAGFNLHADHPLRDYLGPQTGGHVGFEAWHVRPQDAFKAWARWWTVVRGGDGTPERMES